MQAAMLKPKPRMLLADLRQLIAEARQDVARQVNSALVLLYWRVGQRIRRDILKFGGSLRPRKPSRPPLGA